MQVDQQKDTNRESGEIGRIITLGEAAKILNVSRATVYRMAEEGELKAFRMRNIWRTSTTVCEEYIAEQFKKQALICQSTEKR